MLRKLANLSAVDNSNLGGVGGAEVVKTGLFTVLNFSSDST